MALCRWCEQKPVRHGRHERYGHYQICDDCGPIYDNQYTADTTVGPTHVHDGHCDGEPKKSAEGACKRVRKGDRGLRISMGCGRHTMDGWFCIDAVQHPKATRPLDLVSDVKKLDLPDGCASELLGVHIFEHIFKWEADEVLKEWSRLLRKGGKIALEMPDLMKCCRNVLEGRRGPKHPDQLGMWGLFGDDSHKDPFMTHKWAYTLKTIKPMLENSGFIDIVERPTEWHLLGQLTRDFRVEAKKK